MASRSEPVVRDAEHDDVAAICRFGEAHIRPHYAPLIGAEAADEQVRRWWNETHVGAAVAEALVVVAEADGQIVGVGQRGRRGADHVVYKLYVHPQQRGRGLGPQLLDALTRQLPAHADRLYIEHFVANERAGAFYEREGFTVEGLNQVLRKTLHSGSCGVPAIWLQSNRRTDKRDAGTSGSGLAYDIRQTMLGTCRVDVASTVSGSAVLRRRFAPFDC